MNLSLAVAILDANLKGPTATFDEQGLNAVRWAWLTVKEALSAAPASPESLGVSQDAPKPEPTLQRTGEGVEAENAELRAAILRLREGLEAVLMTYLDGSEHGGDHHDDECPVCIAIKKGQDALRAILSEGSVKS